MTLILFASVMLMNLVNLSAKPEDIQWMKPGHTGNVKVLNLTSDGKYLVTTAQDSSVKIINTEDNYLVFKTKTGDNVLFAGISQDKFTLFLGTQDKSTFTPTVTTFDINQKTKTGSFVLESSTNVSNITISPDCKFIAGLNTSNKIQLWNAENGYLLQVFDKDSNDKAYNYAFSSINSIAIAYDNTLRIYNLGSFGIDKEFNITNTSNSSIFFNSDGTQIIKSTNNGDISIYNTSTGKLELSSNVVGYNLKQVILLKDPSRMVINIDGVCSYWDVQNNMFIKELGIGLINNVIYSAQNNRELLIAGCNNGITKIWDLNSDTLVKYTTNNYSRSTLCYNGKYIQSNLKIIIDKETGNILLETKNQVYTIKDTIYYYFTMDSLLYLGSVENNSLIDSINFHKILRSFFFSDNMRFCNYSTKDKPQITNIMDWETKSIVCSDSLLAIKFSGNNRFAAGLNVMKNQLNIIDLQKGSITYKMDLINISNTYFCFSNQGQNIFIRQAGENVKMYNANDMNLIREFKMETESISNSFISISADDKYLIDGADNGDVRIWEIGSSSLKAKYMDYSERILTLDISPDLKYVLAGYRDGTVFLWKTNLVPSSVNENLSKPAKGLNIYPNPVNDMLKVEGINPQNNEKVGIFSSFGIKIFESITEDKIDVGFLPPGMYYIRIGNNFQKFIKL